MRKCSIHHPAGTHFDYDYASTSNQRGRTFLQYGLGRVDPLAHQSGLLGYLHDTTSSTGDGNNKEG
jgi:hypothetical protein